MASIVNRDKGHKWIQFTAPDKRRKTIRLGRISKRDAEEIKSVVEAILVSQISQLSLMPEKAKWIRDAPEEIYDKFAKVGLLPEREKPSITELKPFLTQFIESQKGVKKPQTINNYEQAKSYLLQHFGSEFDMAVLNKAEVTRFREFLVKAKLSVNTINRHIGRMKQFWNAARDAELIDWTKDPFQGQKTQVRPNEKRFEYVAHETIKKVIDAIHDPEWKLILGLCRFAGLRSPSEVLGLKWEDVNWEESKILVDSSKTGPRWVPLFKDLYPLLSNWFEKAPEGSVHVIQRYRDTNSNLRTQLERWCKKAGVDMWGKPFQNLRSSCEIDLNQHYPMHVVARWLGHSENIAYKHYLRTTDEDFRNAATTSLIKETGEAKCEADPDQSEVKSEAIVDGRKESANVKTTANSREKVGSSQLFPTLDVTERHPGQDSNLRPTD